MSRYATCVITTIQAPTPAVRALQIRLAQDHINLIVVGDKKGPASFDLPDTQFLSLESQLKSNFQLAKLLPTGHYTRKNIGYLTAFAANTQAIYETDDDNAPNTLWAPKHLTTQARTLIHTGWFNIYRCFANANIWPRGLPLRHARDIAPYNLTPSNPNNSPIQQLLSNNAPDVDAAWRLTIANEPFTFDRDATDAIHLAPGAWCPFNSQATWWFRDAFPLMYLPSTCTFRMTDIWRSLIAQRCLWEQNQGVTFHPPEVVQDRNAHDLMKDFEDEIPGYLKNEQIAQILASTRLTSNHLNNLIKCYDALIAEGIFKPTEMDLLRAWIADFEVTQ
jgi:hypothetical protein